MVSKKNVSESKNKEISKPIETGKLEFQISDWNSYHELDGDDMEKYVIQLFGRTEDDKETCIKVTDYTPFFYVEVPSDWNKKQADKFVSILKSRVSWSSSNNPNYDCDLSHSLIRHKLVEKHKFYNFTNKKFFKFVMLVFKSHTGMREFANVLARPLKAPGLTKEPMLYQRYESNIEPHIRFMHINNLSSCGWVSLDRSKIKKNSEYSDCHHSYSVNWKDVRPADNDDRMAPFKIMGYDIECVSCDHNFPQSDRKTDKIIQIGITMYRYGSMNCYEQHILTLKECAKIKDANVECYKTEKGLLRGFAKKLKEIKSDFKAGYNNFGFDDKFIVDRINRIDKEAADKQGINVDQLESRFIDEFMTIIGKVNNEYLMKHEGLKKSLTYYQVQNLSSSALGDNELKFIQVPGILSVDMMKIIQRDHRLIGYKLDNVSANFITEGAAKFVEGEETSDGKMNVNIYTKSTKALEVESYIQIMVNDGYSSTPLSEGAKYKVLDIVPVIEKKFNEKENREETFEYQCIKTEISKKDVADLREILLNPLLKVYWTFAKDDMHHTLINKYFKEGDPKKIKLVAKYCLKDCKLVNLLLAKLEIIVNSVGMAKVCHVPLSYLFLRGQGVKIFSLVSKKCREKNYLIPVLRKKKKDATGDEEDSYEGATVITPKPDVYLSPIGVLDYSSLYPNSMRERNLSQECYVNEKKYDNLPGYIYHDIFIVMKDKKGKIIRNIDGTAQKEHHRFAQELISDEQINLELKDVYGKIQQDLEKSIETLKKQIYTTEDNRKELFNYEKANFDKIVEDFKAKTDISEKSKTKLIDKAKAEFDAKVATIVKINSDIKTAKDTNDGSVKKIKDNTDLSEEKKTKKLESLKKSFEEAVDEATEIYELTEEDKEILIQIENAKAGKKRTDEKNKKYNIVNGQMVRYGILPEILTELLNKRKDTNDRLKHEKDSFKRAILNALQLAFKVTANSLYGQTGAPTSPIFFIAIAASTTAIGRERLHYAKAVVEENFEGAEVIYGDSVTGDTPLIVLDDHGDIDITTIEELGSKWTSYNQFKAGDPNRSDKQQAKVNCKVWTSNGWAKIKRVIRHKTSKKIYRVLTHTGCVDVTEDHSLLDKNKNIIKPTECDIGTELLHGFMEQSESKSHNLSKSQIYQLGLSKNITHDILNGDIATKQLFINGYTFGLKKTRKYYKHIDCNDKLTAQQLFYILKCCSYNIKINADNDKIRISFTKHQIKTDNLIKKIDIIGKSTNIFVYDLETTDGTFNAGVGELIVKNTDSIFINFHLRDADGNERTDSSALLETIALCKKAAALINAKVPKPQAIVYEKTLHPFILVAKKKYVGLLFEDDDKKFYLKSMGIVLKRRDNAPIVKIVVGGIIDYLLKHRDIDKAIAYTKEVLTKLMDGKYPIDKFIISKTLKAKYKKPSTIAHKVLADRMAERDPGNKPQVNDRIPFVYIVKDMGKKKKKDILQGDLVEHPDHVLKTGMKIDYLYYLEHQIINPATQILELIMPTREVKKFFRKFIIKEENKRKGRTSMEKWMDPEKLKKVAAGSKSAKKQNQSAKTMKKTKSKLPDLPRVGNTQRHEHQNMDKWLDYSTVKQEASIPSSKVQVNYPKEKKVIDKDKRSKNLDALFKNSKKTVDVDGDWQPSV